jgi:5-methylcytosine-specific restriction endonuclease McrA
MDTETHARLSNLKFGQHPNRFTALDVWNSGDGTCGICNEPIDLTIRYPDAMAFVVEHVKGRMTAGGLDVIENTQSAHSVCNQRKGVREYWERGGHWSTSERRPRRIMRHSDHEPWRRRSAVNLQTWAESA